MQSNIKYAQNVRLLSEIVNDSKKKLNWPQKKLIRLKWKSKNSWTDCSIKKFRLISSMILWTESPSFTIVKDIKLCSQRKLKTSLCRCIKFAKIIRISTFQESSRSKKFWRTRVSLILLINCLFKLKIILKKRQTWNSYSRLWRF